MKVWKQKKLKDNEKIIDGKLFESKEELEEEDFKIFEADRCIDAYRKCFEAGLRPASLKEVNLLIKAKKIEDIWYDLQEGYDGVEIVKITKDNLEQKGLRRLYRVRNEVFYCGDDGLLVSYSPGRVVGVPEDFDVERYLEDEK